MARLLFVTSRLPFPPREGHQLRSWHLLRAAARKHQVTLLSLRRPEDAACLPFEVRRTFVDVEMVDLPALASPLELPRMASQWLCGPRPLLDIRYVTRPLKKAFARRVRDCDLVHLDMLALAGLLRQIPAGIPSVLNEHNIESRLARARIGVEPGAWQRTMARAQLIRLERFEREACGRARRVLACSQLDADLLRQLSPGAEIAVVPNGVDTASFAPADVGPGHAESLLFVGHLGWFPNRDGIEFFTREIMPHLAHRRRLTVDVVGRKAGYSPGRHAAANVHFSGFVNDLQDRVQRAAVFIVPLRLGSGTRLKVLEAMAMGKAIVSTTKGVEGIGLVHDDNVLIADAPEAFARSVERLLDDPHLRIRLGSAARRAAVEHYDWQRVGGRLLAVYDELLDTAVPVGAGPVLEETGARGTVSP